MTKSELINLVSQKTGQTQKKTAEILDVFLDEITQAMVRGESVMFTGFGKFEVRHRKERQGVNPKTQEPITIEARNVPVFKAGAKLKEVIRG